MGHQKQMIFITSKASNIGLTLQPEMPKGDLIGPHLIRENMAKRRATQHYRIKLFRARQERRENLRASKWLSQVRV